MGAKIGSSALEKFHDTEYLIGTIPDLLYTSSGSSVDWMKAVGGVKYSYALELRDAGRFGFPSGITDPGHRRGNVGRHLRYRRRIAVENVHRFQGVSYPLEKKEKKKKKKK